MVNLISAMVSMEMLWIQFGEWFFLWRSCGKINVFSGLFMEEHGKSIHKSITLHTVFVLSA